jgi:predicted dehydrogenase
MHIAVVGLGFGQAFVPIYKAHPAVSQVTLCDLNQATAGEFPELPFVDSLEKVLLDPSVDAVHLLTPPAFHAQQTLAVLAAGKHCACAVTMASRHEDLTAIVQTVKSSGLTYMMMETGVFTREYLYARDLRDSGRLGEVSFLRADYFQDLEGAYADYWRAVPPMHYSTHAVGPMLGLMGKRAARVTCVGGGKLRSDIYDSPENPFPMQTALIQLKESAAVAQVNRAWYQTSRQYVESFSVYGDKLGFEWQQLEDERPVLFDLGPVTAGERRWGRPAERVETPLRPDLYPKELAPFADGWHGGSHPHLVHEFLTSILEKLPPIVDAATAAHWTAVGLCAHESSLRNGEWIDVPSFD